MSRKAKRYQFSENRPSEKSTPSQNSLSNKVNNYKLKPKTPGQQLLVDSIYRNKITLCDGPPGCGKSHLAICVGMEMLLGGQVEKLVISRPYVEAGESIGFSPGSPMEKCYPFLINTYEEMERYLSPNDIKTLLGQNKIEVVPFAYMRGRNFINSYVYVSEAQNITQNQFKLLLTRYCTGSIMVVEGDVHQSDLRTKKESGFEKYFEALKTIPEIGVVELGVEDIVREGIIKEILKVMDEVDSKR
jgi:phosphate starvation-inducible PhoH-like protein